MLATMAGCAVMRNDMELRALAEGQHYLEPGSQLREGRRCGPVETDCHRHRRVYRKR